MTEANSVEFSIGQVVQHRLFNYRGVIIDVDPFFCGTDEWYETVALSRPPKQKPWYHVLVDGASHQTYVAERNLLPDNSGKPVNHPLVTDFFSDFKKGAYSSRGIIN